MATKTRKSSTITERQPLFFFRTAPHFGHAVAIVLTSFPHSLRFLSAMPFLLWFHDGGSTISRDFGRFFPAIAQTLASRSSTRESIFRVCNLLWHVILAQPSPLGWTEVGPDAPRHVERVPGGGGGVKMGCWVPHETARRRSEEWMTPTSRWFRLVRENQYAYRMRSRCFCSSMRLIESSVSLNFLIISLTCLGGCVEYL